MISLFQIIFLAPEIVISGSKKIKASAGFDAIAQALESLISMKSNDKSVEFAKKSLKISMKNYLNYINTPNIDNTLAMCQAANLSGEAINISKTTAPHALSYPFTAIFNVPHGHAVSLTLGDFLKFNYQNMNLSKSPFNLKKRYELIFDLTGTKNPRDLENFCKMLQHESGLENNFEKLNIDIKKEYSTILSGINLMRLKNNPIDIDIETIKKILLSKKN